MSTTTEYLLQSTATTVLSTELNSLGAGSYALSSSSFDNENPTANFNGYTQALIEIVLATPSAGFAANSAIALYFIKSIDGTNFEDSESAGAIVSVQAPDYQWPITGTSADGTAKGKRIVRKVWLPPGNFKVMLGNIQGSGTQALAATSNTVKILPATTQGV